MESRIFTNEFASVDGSITPLPLARIPVTDHGFLYGDSVYETIRTYDRRPFFLQGHLGRLERSAAAIRLRVPWSREVMRSQLERTLAAAHDADPSYGGEFAIRVVATRGTGPLGYDPALCPEPTLVLLVTRLRQPSRNDIDVGIEAVIASVRRNPIESLDPRIKSSNLLNNILAAQQAKDAGAAEAILFNTAGHLAEGTLTNVFMVKGDRVMTPSVDCGILSGITREILLEAASASGAPIEEGRYGREQLETADEIFLTSTTREILPVARLDGRPIGAARRGPVTQRLQMLFRRRVQAILDAEATPGGG